MTNLALYRKYRSADFSEVIAQESIVKTLSNAIKSGKHSHAYLLAGPRGVGKTTVARIIAKQLNGLKKTDVISDFLDIIEIDGASNRGIDEIRNLREKVHVSPAKLAYKVYIIDEVHMLTREAFNALLKTLEEPPPHVVFIFATTEVHKLPETIVSRTQRFDFKPIPPSAITKHLRFIADQEKIKIDDSALDIIARVSNGGFRDAISLLDQISSLDGPITPSIVLEFTGLQDNQAIQSIIQARQNNDFSLVIELTQQLIDAGADAGLLTQQLLDTLQFNLLSSTKHEQASMLALASDLHWAQTNMRYSSSPGLVLQVALARNSLLANLSKPSTVKADQPSAILSQPPDKPLSKPSTRTIASTVDSQPTGNDDLLIKSLSVIKHHNNSLYAVMRGSSIVITNNEINITCQFSFHRDRISEPHNTSLVEETFSKVYGRKMHLAVQLSNIKAPTTVNSQEELLNSAVAILGGEIIDA